MANPRRKEHLEPGPSPAAWARPRSSEPLPVRNRKTMEKLQQGRLKVHADTRRVHDVDREHLEWIDA